MTLRVRDTYAEENTIQENQHLRGMVALVEVSL